MNTGGSQRKLLKPVVWMGSSLEDRRKFPAEAQSHIGFALKQAQLGGKHVDAKPLRGFGGASVLEIVENFAGDAYRGVYCVKFPAAIYFLHAFQKKSKSGIATPKREINLIAERLKRANELYSSGIA